MVYDRNARGDTSGDTYRSDDGYGRDPARSSAREYQAAGYFDREARDRARDRDGRGRQDYGNAGYAGDYNDRAERGQGFGPARGGYDRSDDGARRGPQSYGARDARRGPPGRDDGRQPQGYDHDDRGFMDRAGDEVRSWFGDEAAERRRDMDARYDERGIGSAGDRHQQHRDSDYHAWRQTQISQLDRDYEEYRREHRAKFENEFSTWRTGRQGQRALLTKVEEHMDVVGSDGGHVGTVDKVRGDRILLTKNDPDAGGHHHSIPSSWLKNVGTTVTLAKTADEAKQHWRDEERNQATMAITAGVIAANRMPGATRKDGCSTGAFRAPTDPDEPIHDQAAGGLGTTRPGPLAFAGCGLQSSRRYGTGRDGNAGRMDAEQPPAGNPRPSGCDPRRTCPS